MSLFLPLIITFNLLFSVIYRQKSIDLMKENVLIRKKKDKKKTIFR